MTAELKAKAKSWRYWLTGLVDAVVIGALTSVVSGFGLEATGKIETLDLSVMGTLAASGALIRLSQFWVQHPLSSLGEK